MCEVATIATVASAVSGTAAVVGAYQQGQAAKAMGRNNQIMAEYAAQDALRRGDAEAAAVQRRASQVQGAQRAALAAKGLDINAGTAGELQDQTDFFSQVDQSTARTNAARDAWSARVQGANARAQGDAAARQGTTGAFATLLGTGAQVADKWATWSKPQGFQGYGGRY